MGSVDVMRQKAHWSLLGSWTRTVGALSTVGCVGHATRLPSWSTASILRGIGGYPASLNLDEGSGNLLSSLATQSLASESAPLSRPAPGVMNAKPRVKM